MGHFQAMKDLEEEFSAAVGAFSLTGPILSFTLAIISIASGTMLAGFIPLPWWWSGGVVYNKNGKKWWAMDVTQ